MVNMHVGDAAHLTP